MKYSLQVMRSPDGQRVAAHVAVDARAQRGDAPDDLVAEHSRAGVGPVTLPGVDVGAADRRHRDAYQHLAFRRRPQRVLAQFEGSVRARRRPRRGPLDGIMTRRAVDGEVEDLVALEASRGAQTVVSFRGGLRMKGTRASVMAPWLRRRASLSADRSWSAAPAPITTLCSPITTTSPSRSAGSSKRRQAGLLVQHFGQAGHASKQSTTAAAWPGRRGTRRARSRPARRDAHEGVGDGADHAVSPAPNSRSRMSCRKITFGLPSSRRLVVHAVVGGQRHRGAEIGEAAEGVVDAAVELVGHRVAGRVLVLDVVGQRQEHQLGPARSAAHAGFQHEQRQLHRVHVGLRHAHQLEHVLDAVVGQRAAVGELGREADVAARAGPGPCRAACAACPWR
jgi:hypothetical protein